MKLECYPVLALINRLKSCKFVSRSDLVLDANYSLDLLGFQEAQFKEI